MLLIPTSPGISWRHKAQLVIAVPRSLQDTIWPADNVRRALSAGYLYPQ